MANKRIKREVSQEASQSLFGVDPLGPSQGSAASTAVPDSQTFLTQDFDQLGLSFDDEVPSTQRDEGEESLLGADAQEPLGGVDDEDGDEELPPYHEFHTHRNVRRKAAILVKKYRGMNLLEREPSVEGLLQPFLHRYHGIENVNHLWSFSYQYYGKWVKATLKTSGISRDDRVFEGGEWCYSTRLAEMAAIQVFREDAEVRAIAEQIPPTMQRIRENCLLNKHQKKALRDCDIDPGVVHKELMQILYMHFRALGCRTALWDGNM